MSGQSEVDWQRLAGAFDAVMRAPAEQRGRVLAEVSGHDRALRAELESLLVAQSRHGPDFDRGPATLIGDQLADASARVGSWTLLRIIGHGGMGEVWLAERDQAGVQQRAALKRAPSADPLLVEHLENERRVLAKLNHPAIPPVLDIGADCLGRPYYAMPFLEQARPLTRFRDAQRGQLAARLRVMIPVCDAVAHAHAHLVVHGDLKPGNVVVTPDGHVHLLDFGLARLLGDGARQSPGDGQLMTPAYASPERRSGGLPTTASDVFSLGALLYELCCGQPPADGALAPSRMAQPGVARRLRGDLDAICARALAADPAARYPAASALAEDLRRWFAGLPVSARAPTLAYQLACLLRRHRLAALAGGLALAALGGVAVLSWRSALAEAAHARRLALERDRAEQVVGFLQQLFASTDPLRQSATAASAADVLARGAEELARPDGKLDPAARVAAYTALAGALRALGDYPQAAAMLDAADQTRRADLPAAWHAAMLLERSRLAYRLEEFDTAVRAAEQAWSIANRELARHDLRRAPYLNALGLALLESGDMLRAETVMRGLVDWLGRTADHARSLEYGIALADLADLLHARGELGVAQPLYERALLAFAAHGDAGRSHAAITYNALGRLHERRADSEAALQAYDRALAVARPPLGDGHPFIGVALRNRGRLRLLAGDASAAREDYAAALAGATTHWPDGHPAIARSQLGLGRAWLALGAPEQAWSLLAVAEGVLAEADPARAGVARLAMAQAALATGRAEQGRALLRKVAASDDPDQAAQAQALLRGDLER